MSDNSDEELSTDDQLRMQARAHKKAEKDLQDENIVQSGRGMSATTFSRVLLTYFQWYLRMIPRGMRSQNKSYIQCQYAPRIIFSSFAHTAE